jgi:MFS family permease
MPEAMSRQVKIIIAIAVLYGIGFGIYEFALPLFLKANNVTYVQMGHIYMAGAIVQFFLTLYLTSLADTFGRKRVYTGGLACGLAAYFLTPLTWAFWHQTVFKTLREIAQSVQAKLQSVLVYENVKTRFFEFFSRARGGEYACQAFGTITAIVIINQGVGYEPTFLAAGVLMIVAAGLAIGFLREPAHVELSAKPVRFTSLFKLDLHPKLYLLALGMFLFHTGLFTSHSQYLLLFWRDKFAVSDQTLGVIAILHRLSLGVLMIVLPMLFVGWVRDRPRKALYVCAVAAEGVMIAASALIANFYWAAGVWLLHDFVGAALWIPIQQQLILKYARPESRASDVARVAALGSLGIILGPLIAGYLLDYTGALPALFSGVHDLPYFVSGILVALSALPLLFL